MRTSESPGSLHRSTVGEITVDEITVDEITGDEITDSMAVPSGGRVDRRALLVLALAIVVFTMYFGVWVYRRVNRFGAFDFDMGIYDQAMWLIPHGRLFNTIRGLNFFGHHLNITFLLFVPFSIFGAGSIFLSVTQVFALGLGAIPIYALARRRLGSDWWPLVPSAAYLAHPSLGWMSWELFHPDTMAIPCVFAAWYYGRERRWKGFCIWGGLAMLWKEDIALAMLAMGLMLACTRDRPARRIPLAAAGVALTYFLLATKIVLPHLAPGGDGEPFYQQFYDQVGGSPSGIAKKAATEPSVIIDQLRKADIDGYGVRLAGPYGYVPVVAAPAALMGAPQTGVNLLGNQEFFWSTHYHYAAMPLAGLTIAMVEGLGLLRRRRCGMILVAVASLCIVGGSVWGTREFSVTQWGPSEFYEGGYWPIHGNARQAVMEHAKELPPTSANVSATYNFVPKLTHRAEIYTFPNPWQTINWGARGENPRDPDRVDWLVLDRAVFDDNARVLLDSIIRTGEFETVFEDADAQIIVLRRAPPPDPSPTPPTPPTAPLASPLSARFLPANS